MDGLKEAEDEEEKCIRRKRGGREMDEEEGRGKNE